MDQGSGIKGGIRLRKRRKRRKNDEERVREGSKVGGSDLTFLASPPLNPSSSSPMESERPVYRRDYVHLSDIPSLRFGTKGQGEGQFWDPAGVASNTKGDIIVSDSNNHRVQVFGHVGGFLFQFGSPGKGQGQFQHPAGVAVDRFNRILIADSLNHRIQIFDDKGVFLRSFGSEGRNDGEFDSIGGIAIEPGSGNYYVADYRNHRVQVRGFF